MQNTHAEVRLAASILLVSGNRNKHIFDLNLVKIWFGKVMKQNFLQVTLDSDLKLHKHASNIEISQM